MYNEFKENKLYQIFIDADDFCNSLEKWLAERGLGHSGNSRKTPQPQMSASEILTIMCFYPECGRKSVWVIRFGGVGPAGFFFTLNYLFISVIQWQYL